MTEFGVAVQTENREFWVGDLNRDMKMKFFGYVERGETLDQAMERLDPSIPTPSISFMERL